jgi:hypothetical protein
MLARFWVKNCAPSLTKERDQRQYNDRDEGVAAKKRLDRLVQRQPQKPGTRLLNREGLGLFGVQHRFHDMTMTEEVKGAAMTKGSC